MSTSRKANRPAYWLKVTDKHNTKNRTNAGAAWVSEFSQLRIVLNPGIRLNWDDEVWLTLEPIDPDNPPQLPKTLRTTSTGAPAEGDSTAENEGSDDDIPF